MEPIRFWKDPDKKTIDPTLYSKTAEQMARDLATAHEKSRKQNRRTQIRKFYDEVIRLDTEAKKTGAAENRGGPGWDDILPLVHLLTAKAAYAEGRELVSTEFSSFIRSAVDQVNEPVDLAVFANFFEAVMGFYRLYGPSN